MARNDRGRSGLTTATNDGAWTLTPAMLAEARRVQEAFFPALCTIECAGISPLLLDHVTEEKILDIDRGARGPKFPKPPDAIARVAALAKRRLHGDAAAQEERAAPEEWAAFHTWERQCYRDLVAAPGIPRMTDGRPYIPVRYLEQCLVAAGQYVTHARLGILTDPDPQGGSSVPALLEIIEPELPLPNDLWELDLRPGWRHGEANPDLRKSIARAKYRNWGFTVTIACNPTLTPGPFLHELFTIAGERIGIGCFRKDPRKQETEVRAVFGRFRPTRCVMQTIGTLPPEEPAA
ncbi:hypothetical protein HY632_04045 [Candidatus Uhrbacteria bacterium]|nr:hypothetical protein [Candidatus Uhrbacteria bacterium]